MADSLFDTTNDPFMGYGLYIYALVSIHVCAFLYWVYLLTLKQKPVALKPPEHQD